MTCPWVLTEQVHVARERVWHVSTEHVNDVMKHAHQSGSSSQKQLSAVRVIYSSNNYIAKISTGLGDDHMTPQRPHAVLGALALRLGSRKDQGAENHFLTSRLFRVPAQSFPVRTW